jgi:hypothetical protein
MRQEQIKGYFVGKTIENVEFVDPCTLETCYREEVDDHPYIKLIFTDKTSVTLIPGYGDYTGNSIGEYGTFLGIMTGKENEIDNSGVQDSN